MATGLGGKRPRHPPGRFSFGEGQIHACYCLRRRRHLLRCVGRLFSSPASCRRIRTAAALDSALQIAGEGEVAAVELVGC
jgi:hypothetical protein